ncbi:MAG: hypothetical protein EXS35_07550 [Pedosphaera sp.]|nr:hypothetical protein [Pedosphaera sp.]
MNPKRCCFQDLPDDVQTLVSDIVGIMGSEHDWEELKDHEFEIHELPVAVFPSVPVSTDYRDEEYAEAMIWKKLPPLLIHGHKWLDGRHRIWAFKRMGITSAECINLGEIFPDYSHEPIGLLNFCTTFKTETFFTTPGGMSGQ